MSYLNVNELFGPTVQGEGIWAGQQAVFLRLAGCNLACTWCDTPYSWDWERFDRSKESHKRSVETLAIEISYMLPKDGVLVITGGEPLLQQRALVELTNALGSTRIQIETNGTIVPDAGLTAFPKMVTFSVSPKLAHAGDAATRRINPEAIEAFLSHYYLPIAFKFVAQNETDLDEIQDTYVTPFNIPAERVWVMPEGATRERHLTNLEALADAIVVRGWNISTRLHVLAWNTKRGV